MIRDYVLAAFLKHCNAEDYLILETLMETEDVFITKVDASQNVLLYKATTIPEWLAAWQVCQRS